MSAAGGQRLAVEVLASASEPAPPLASLTREQHAIVNTSRDDVNVGTNIVHVTAAAGAGKTTVLQHLAAKLQNNGYITYVVFNRAAAEEAQGKLPQVDCRTCASLAKTTVEKSIGERIPIENDAKGAYVKLADDVCADDISRLLDNVRQESRRRTRKTILHYIAKTLLEFLHSDGEKPTTTYYPAIVWHREDAPEGVPRDPGDIYIRCASALWDLIKQGPRTFEAIQKVAQLCKLKLHNNNLLVDEAQDLDGAQLAWLVDQSIVHDKRLWLVGDAAQTIYSFRGVRSSKLASLHNTAHYTLGGSFRFNARIAAVANTVLWLKSLTQPDLWKPYRVRGCGAHGEVTVHSAVGGGEPVTLITRTRAALLIRACDIGATNPHLALAINGGSHGDGRGHLRGWGKFLDEVKMFYEVFTSSRNSLPLEDLDDSTWDDWRSLVDAIKTRELKKYHPHVMVIDEYGDQALSMVERFRADVVRKAIPVDRADVVLSTTHAAKGMEWDIVELANDFIELAEVEMKHDGSAAFKIPSKGDDLNLWYVAVTRAKRKLTIPPKLMKLVEWLRTDAPTTLSRQWCDEMKSFHGGIVIDGHDMTEPPPPPPVKQESVDV